MKAIQINIVDITPMFAKTAKEKGYFTFYRSEDTPGYEIQRDNEYKDWIPKDVAKQVYYIVDNKTISILQKIKLNLSKILNDK